MPKSTVTSVFGRVEGDSAPLEAIEPADTGTLRHNMALMERQGGIMAIEDIHRLILFSIDMSMYYLSLSHTLSRIFSKT